MAKHNKIASAILNQIASDPSLADDLEQIAFDAEVAKMIYQARQEAGYTQTELAELAGTKQSVIARLEDWDYSGHSLSMLKRIGDALGKRLHVEYRPRYTEFRESSFSVAGCGLAGLQWEQVLWTPQVRTTGASLVGENESYGLVA